MAGVKQNANHMQRVLMTLPLICKIQGYIAGGLGRFSLVRVHRFVPLHQGSTERCSGGRLLGDGGLIKESIGGQSYR